MTNKTEDTDQYRSRSAEGAGDSGTESPTPPYWHKTARLSDGTPVGRLGAYWYILDQNSCAVSDGYHEIWLKDDGTYRGKRSALTETIVPEEVTDAEQR